MKVNIGAPRPGVGIRSSWISEKNNGDTAKKRESKKHRVAMIIFFLGNMKVYFGKFTASKKKAKV